MPSNEFFGGLGHFRTLWEKASSDLVAERAHRAALAKRAEHKAKMAERRAARKKAKPSSQQRGPSSVAAAAAIDRGGVESASEDEGGGVGEVYDEVDEDQSGDGGLSPGPRLVIGNGKVGAFGHKDNNGGGSGDDDDDDDDDDDIADEDGSRSEGDDLQRTEDTVMASILSTLRHQRAADGDEDDSADLLMRSHNMLSLSQTLPPIGNHAKSDFSLTPPRSGPRSASSSGWGAVRTRLLAPRRAVGAFARRGRGGPSRAVSLSAKRNADLVASARASAAAEEAADLAVY